MSLFYFLVYAGIGVYNPYLSLHLHRLGLSATEIGLLMTISPVISLLTQPIWGLVTDWLQDRRKLLMIMLVGIAGVSLLFPYGHTLGQLLVIMSLMAIFMGAMIPVADSLTLEEVERTGGDYAGRRVWGSAGFALAAFGSGWLFTRLPLASMFVLFAVLITASAVVVWRMPRSTGPAPSWQALWGGLREVGRARGLWLFLFVVFLAQVATQAHGAFFSIYLDSLHAREVAVGLTWTLSALVEIPILRLVGRLIRRYGPIWPAGIGIGLFSLRWLLYSLAVRPEQVFMIQMIAGMNFAFYQPSTVALVGDLSPRRFRATGQTLFAAVGGGLAAIVGNQLGGRIVDRFGPSHLYLAAAGLAFGSLLLFILLSGTIQKHLPSAVVDGPKEEFS